METLPLEMVDQITQYLDPQDLARLCAVSCKWREIFNQDRLWKRYCDPALEEALRTTPCVVEPKFDSPENEDSTLTSISQWRLALIREKHLWKNWKLKNIKKESISMLKNEIQINFLSDTLIVRWCSNRIEIWDVSVIPASLVAKTDSSLDMRGCFHLSVVGNSMLIAKLQTNALVFHMDILNKCIKLKNKIVFGEVENVLPNDDNRIEVILHRQRILNKQFKTWVKGNILFHVDNSGSNLDLFDLEIGKKVKAEPCPELEDGSVKVCICETKSSDTSDGLVVTVGLHIPGCGDYYVCNFHYYVYSTKDLRFLPGPIVKSRTNDTSSIAIHKHYIAIPGPTNKFKIFSYITSEVLFEQYFSQNRNVSVFNDAFIFFGTDVILRKIALKVFTPAKKTLRTVIHLRYYFCSIKIINDKYVALYEHMRTNDASVWEPSGQTLKPSDISGPFQDEINQVFTRGTDNVYQRHSVSTSTINIYYYW